MCCQLVSACYTAGGELQKLIVKCQAFDQVFNTILCNQEECSVLVQAFDTLYTLSDHGMYSTCCVVSELYHEHCPSVLMLTC